jgi:hypothetical protein
MGIQKARSLLPPYSGKPGETLIGWIPDRPCPLAYHPLEERLVLLPAVEQIVLSLRKTPLAISS